MFWTTPEFPVVVKALNEGFLVTLQLFFVTLIGAVPLGLIISFGSMSRWAPLRRPIHWALTRKGKKPGRVAKLLSAFRPISLICRLVVWVIRGTPLILQIIALFYVPGMLDLFTWGGGESSRFAAVAVAFIINYACYFSEIFRGGIQAIPNGQYEAGQVLGMTKTQIFFKITLLQVIKRIIPPMGNEFINLVKDTALARTIAVYEVLWMGEKFIKSKGIIWPLFYTAVFYLVFNGLLTLLFGWIEKKMDYFK